MLDAGAIERLCLSFPGVQLSIQWGGQRVFKIGGRMFATIGSREPHRVSFKCNEIAFHTLTEGPGVIPAPYLARARRSEEPTSELQSLMRISSAVFCLKK